MVYRYNVNRPPSQKDSDDIFHELNVFEFIGFDEWADSKQWMEQPPHTVMFYKTVKENYQFLLSREYRWIVIPPIYHYSEKRHEKIVETRGYKKTESEKMQRELNIDVSAGVPWANLKASVKQNLRLNNETTQEWHEETSVTIEQDYEANVSYVKWALVDRLTLRKTILREERDERDILISIGPVPDIPDLLVDNVLTYFYDKASDKEIEEGKKKRAGQI